MLPDIVVHIILVLAIVSGYFWLYLVPTIQEGLRSTVTDMMAAPLESATMHSNCAALDVLQYHLSDKTDLYAGADQQLKRANAIAASCNAVFVLLVLVLGWVGLVAVRAWKTDLAYAALEAAVTYTIVIGLQLWFVNTIAYNYIPFTNDDVGKLLKEGARQHCLK